MRRGTVLKTVATVAVLGVVGSAAVFADGFDAQEVPQLETSVWVSRDAGQFARVNTVLGEIDTVRSVGDPSAILQHGSSAVVFSQGFAQMWPIDPAAPSDLIAAGDGEADASSGGASAVATPALTRQVSAAGERMLFLTETGEVFLSRIPDASGVTAAPAPLDPFASLEVEEGEQRPRYVADAAAVDLSGRVAIFSAAEAGVRLYDAETLRFTGDLVPVEDAPEAGPGTSLTFAGGRWVLAEAESGRVWVEGRAEHVDTGLEDAVLQSSATDESEVLLADRGGLVGVAVADGAVRRIADGSGTPAAPIRVSGVSYAAWVSDAAASLWSSDSDEVRDLEVEADTLADADSDIAPVFRSNGDRAVLNETATGLAWTLPDGALVPTEQWAPLDETVQDEGTVQVDDIIEQEPPVAVPDAFGVRAGALVSLPLLLNDHDPNKDDVLSIDPASLTGLDPAFGTVSLVGDDQFAVVQVAATSGSATFEYAASDGLQSSAPAQVTLTVVPADQNSAPVWCGVAECLQPWPAPQIAPGGFASVSVLPGWVDPEGDAVLLADARADDLNAPVTVVPTADGRVVVRHADPNATDTVVMITVTVSDSLGATATMPLEVRVTTSPSLSVEPVVVSAGVGEQRRVAIADSVTGGSGSYRLVDAVQVRGSVESFTVAPASATGFVELSASQAGEYAATYTVQDTQTLAQQTAIVRFSVQASERPLSAPPLTAFVRASEDATVDVLAAVQNTTGRVLLVQEASTSDPQLSVGVVAQRYVRVSGSTDDGQPGRVGSARVLITDGAGNTATTTLTVFLIAPTFGVGPIAVPDAISVRAGAQIDIPVLQNDVSPRGERLLLHPEVTGSDTEGELVFASGSRVRYLAPETAGTYTVRYSAYLENDPSRTDSATVTVTVLPEGANRPPQPGVLSARVIAGQSVVIPVPTGGLDPDGDSTVLADVEQPDAGLGSVSIGAAGETLIYRAPSGGVRGGQLGFEYTVRDPSGATGTGVVRIGVLAAEVSDVAPVTYSDYVGVQRGSDAVISVRPLLNDRDPRQGALELVEVRPNAPAGSSEWDRLESLLDRSQSFEEGVVVLRAGDVTGINSYVYTVQSSASFSTAEGLIVLGVSDAPSPDHPLVADTVVTVQNRTDLSRGLDVVAGKVQWSTGDPSSLTLSLWREVPGFSVDGHRISGEVGRAAQIVPFTLTGEDAAGRAVTAFGFLRVPAFDDMRVQLASSARPVTVDEEKSATFDVADFIDVAPGDRIDVRSGGAFAVQRAASTCEPASGGRATYTAGREAPWTDSCSVVVRVAGQSTWSVVPVPIEIVPKDPQAILSPVSRTVPPGEQVEVDLLGEMTSWEGGRVGDTALLDFSAQPSAPSFEVSLVDGKVVAVARADARPGTRESVRVAVSSFGGLSAAISLVVGIAAPDAPKGATFSKQCDVSAGPCSITAVGLAGEYDPFAGKTGSGLTLSQVGAAGSVVCPVATVTRADDSRMVANWPSGAKPIGGECVVAFTVADAQGRTGQGQATLDVLGYPQTPASITTAAYGPTSVKVRVSLGEAMRAHPALTGVAIYEGGSRVAADCTQLVGAYECTITGLDNGTPHTYTARAVNSIGESADTTPLTTWAFDAPVVTDLRAESVYHASFTTQVQGRVRVEIDASSDADRLVLYSDGVEVWRGNRTGATTSTMVALPVGSRTLEVVPVSRFNAPISGHQNEGSRISRSVTSVGSPYYSGAPTASVSVGTDSNVVVTISSPPLNANSSSAPSTERWAVWTSGNPSCQAQSDGSMSFTASGAGSFTVQDSPVFSGLNSNTSYWFGVCGSNGFGAASARGASTVFTWVAPNTPGGDLLYTVSTAPNPVSALERRYDFVAGSVSINPAPSGFITQISLNGSDWTTTSTFTLNLGDNPSNPQVRYCHSILTWMCGPTANISPDADSGRNVVRVVFPACFDASQGPLYGVVAHGAAGAYSVSQADGLYTVTFAGQHAALAPITDVVATPCAVPDPDPEPDPAPDPEGP